MRGRVVRKVAADVLAVAVFLAAVAAFLPDALAPGTVSGRGIESPAPSGAGHAGSLASHLLDDATVGMLRLLVVAGGAFVLAALVQRLVLGAFAFEAAGFKLPIDGPAKESLHDTMRLVERQRAEILGKLTERAAVTGEELRDLSQRVTRIETIVHRRIDGTTDEGGIVSLEGRVQRGDGEDA